MKIFRITDSFEPAARWYLRGPRGCVMGNIPDRQGNYELWGKEVMGWHFTSGKKYEGSAPLAIPIQKGTVVLDFTFGSLDMPVLRSRMAQRLKPLCGRAVQWIPAVVPGTDEPFEIANVLALADALDTGRSEVSWQEKNEWPLKAGIASVGRMALKHPPLIDTTMFRLENWRPPLLVSDVVRSVLEELRVSGIRCQEIPLV